MIQRAAVSVVLGLVLFAQVASAHSTLKCDGPSTPTGPAPSLQQILDGLVVAGPAIDANAPIDVELWQNSAGPMTVQLVADYTGKWQGVIPGMYDPDTLKKAFFHIPTPSDVATVMFNDNGSITVHGGWKPNKVFGFEGPFGFFVKTFDSKHHGKHHGKHGDSNIFFTQPALNGDEARAKVFQGDGVTVLKLPGLAPGVFLPSQFLIAWETGLGDANDGQFNDFLFLVSNVVAVTAPEPAFAFLLGISALAVVCGRRARST